MSVIASPRRDKINARILSYDPKADFSRIESASRKINASFYSPEVKRLFVRFFDSMQLNVYFISVIARTKLPHELVEQVEGALKERIERVDAEVIQALQGAEALFTENGITNPASYEAEALAFEVRVISPLARRYLELMTKVDQLMPMLETLAIDELIRIDELDKRKAHWKRTTKQVAGAARNFAAGLRRRMNALDAEAAAASGSETRGDAKGPARKGAPRRGQALPESPPASAGEGQLAAVTAGSPAAV